MKTLKAKIVAVIALLLAVSVIITGGVSVLLGYKATTDTLEQSMSQMAKVASERMKWELGAYKSMASDMGLIKQLSDNDNITTLKTKLDMLAARVADNGFLSGHLVTIAGVSLTDGTNFAGQDFFEAALKGQTFLSDPVINADNTVELKIGAPVWQMAKRGLKVVGVLVVSVDGDILSQIVEGIKVSENGSAYMIDRSGNVIAHRKRELVTVKSNTIADAKTDPSQADLAELEQKMLNGESGFGQYYYGGENKVLSYAPIPETNGWSLAITAPQADFMQQTMRSVYITVALVAVMVLVGIVAATFIARGISQPVKACAERLERVAEGDLTSPVPVVNSKDEMQVLAQATATILFEVQGIISDMDDTLARMANGDLSLDEGRAALYKGDFRNLFLSLQKISGDLSDTMRHIMRAAEQVSLGSGHVSAGAQSLSQGTTEQAGTVQQLFASVSSISEQVKENADNAAQSKHLAAEAEAEVLEGNERMREMTRAMGEIRASSDEIGKIIKAIEDIAFQTNMLALNAAVEAARAGEAGKGFAVVADEVRNLASKSAEAASTTTALIKGSLQAVENGERIAGRTAESLEAVVRRVKELADTVEQITQASQQQARAVAQVTQGMEQISAVVQNNSATAEESAAASEQLSSQASLLQDMMKRFQLGEA